MTNPSGSALNTIGKAISVLELMHAIRAYSTAVEVAIRNGQTHVAPEALDASFRRSDATLESVDEEIARREREEQQP